MTNTHQNPSNDNSTAIPADQDPCLNKVRVMLAELPTDQDAITHVIRLQMELQEAGECPEIKRLHRESIRALAVNVLVRPAETKLDIANKLALISVIKSDTSDPCTSTMIAMAITAVREDQKRLPEILGKPTVN